MLDKLKNTGRNAISVEGVKLALAHPDGALFVDVRTHEEWDEGHIAGFTHIPLSSIEAHIPELKRASRIYFICRSGGRSETACDTLADHDYHNAVNVLGGMIAWEKAKYHTLRTY